MAKRVFGTVPDYLAELLDWKAKKDGRSLSNLVGLYLEQCVAEQLQAEYEADQAKERNRK
jgi:hypothetical protein